MCDKGGEILRPFYDDWRRMDVPITCGRKFDMVLNTIRSTAVFWLLGEVTGSSGRNNDTEGFLRQVFTNYHKPSQRCNHGIIDYNCDERPAVVLISSPTHTTLPRDFLVLDFLQKHPADDDWMRRGEERQRKEITFFSCQAKIWSCLFGCILNYGLANFYQNHYIIIWESISDLKGWHYFRFFHCMD